MNKLENKITQALKTRGVINQANTAVEYSVATEISKVYLHGNQIAEYNHEKQELKVNFCGYATNTTRSRINAICEALGYQQWFNIRGGELHKNVGNEKLGKVDEDAWITITD